MEGQGTRRVAELTGNEGAGVGGQGGGTGCLAGHRCEEGGTIQGACSACMSSLLPFPHAFPHFSHTSTPPRWHIIVEDSANEHIYHSEVSL